MSLSDWLECPHLRMISAQVPGLSFRGFRGAADIETMSKVSHLSWKADGVEWMVSPEETASWLEDKSDHDHRLDLLFAEVGGEVVGFCKLVWDSSEEDPKYYGHSAHLLPQWRGMGITKAMFESNEARIQEISSAHPVGGRAYIKLWAYDGPSEWRGIVESSGFSPIWHLLEMVNADLASVRDHQAPEGLDFGPVRSEEYPKVWALFRDCFSHEQWSSPEEWSARAYDEWLQSPNFTPNLWMVARSGEDVIGVVENYVNEGEWATFGRKVAHSNRVCVRSDWRRKGVSTYLLTRSLKLLRDIGVDEVTLDTEVENKSRAMRVYEGVGFAARRTFTFYAKPL
ncbi:MAG: family N-acetyltransferase [Candidatus Thermoplasmatota archaeon]|nr:family N-acetyltransferase [Candidatus Thermoplasmatota archaeon]